jgi:hypothetical protein
MTWIGIEAGATRSCAAVFFAMDTEAVEMHVAPGKDDLQNVVEGRKGGVAGDKDTAPNQRADAPQDHTELIEAGCSEEIAHTQSVPQRIPLLNPAPPGISRSRADTVTVGTLSHCASDGGDVKRIPSARVTTTPTIVHRIRVSSVSSLMPDQLHFIAQPCNSSIAYPQKWAARGKHEREGWLGYHIDDKTVKKFW